MILRNLGIALWLLSSLHAADLSIEFKPKWQTALIAGSESWHPTERPLELSISRIAFLVSEPVLVDTKGRGHSLNNWYGLVDIEGGKTTLNLRGLPAYKFKAIEFTIGLNSGINNSDPAQFPPNHALNPIDNKLHWNWQDGYIFMALEGHWNLPNETEGGFSYHLGNEPHRMRIRLPAVIDLSKSNAHLELNFQLDQVLGDSVSQKNSATHGRPGDPLARQIKERTEHAFFVDKIHTVEPAILPAYKTQRTSNFIGTPFPLKISDKIPIPPLPVDYPLSNERVELGRRLFHDAQLSRNNTISCASCHKSEMAFTENRKLSIGIDQQLSRRNSMPLVNLAWKDSFFWDGRIDSLRKQALESIENEMEMGASLTEIEQKLSNHPAYPSLFKAAYGSRTISAERIGVAIEQFLLTQISDHSRFDRALRNEIELTEIEKRGLELFFTEHDPRRKLYGADCFHCHGGPLFSDQSYHNNGLVLTSDQGLAEITQRKSDIGKFSTPSLRNVEITAPYMHDGRIGTLREVVEHYRSGIQRSGSLDPNLAKHAAPGIPLSDSDVEALIAFLKTLTDLKYLN
tara:strand:+ start:519 stop:2234 length:1716 start_codon:yes stop_codon:yes gene_type:complete